MFFQVGHLGVRGRRLVDPTLLGRFATTYLWGLAVIFTFKYHILCGGSVMISWGVFSKL